LPILTLGDFSMAIGERSVDTCFSRVAPLLALILVTLSSGCKVPGLSKNLISTSTAQSSAQGATAGTGTGVAYADVAAIVTASCLPCHGGQDSPLLTSYSAIMSGGSVVAGSPSGSTFYSQITSGAMPEAGGSPGAAVSAAQLATIASWITAGAPETAAASPSSTAATTTTPTTTSSTTTAATPTPKPTTTGPTPSPSPKPPVVAAPTVTPSPTPSFTPISNANANYTYLNTNVFQPMCLSCHDGSTAPNFSTYATLLGGNSIVPGFPLQSNTYTYIADGQMPKGGGAVSAANLALISMWISAGAPNSTAAGAAAQVATLSLGPTMTVEEISEQVAGTQFTINVSANYSMLLDDLAWMSDSSGTSFAPISSAEGFTLSEDGKSLSIQVTAGSAGIHSFEIEDTSFVPPHVSDTVVYDVVAPKTTSRVKVTSH
jgi:hypothetical protein